MKSSSVLRSRAVTFGGLLLAGLLSEVASAQPWWRAAGGGAAVTFSGTEATGGLSQALAVVLLAGLLLVLALRRRGRRVVAVLLCAAGLGVTVLGVLRQRPGPDAVRTEMRLVSLAENYALSATAWPLVFALGGVLTVVGAVLLVGGAGSWPARPDRFQRTSSQLASAPADSAGPADSADIWRALDAGVDPTIGSGAEIEESPHPNASELTFRGQNGPAQSPQPDPVSPAGQPNLSSRTPASPLPEEGS